MPALDLRTVVPNDLEFQEEFSKLVSNDVDRITKIIENVLSFARSSSVNIVEQRIEAVIVQTLESTPPDATHWSSRGMSDAATLTPPFAG